MSACPSIDALLEAEVEELSGSRATPLGLHVRACARCRAAAARILDANAALDAVLSARRPLDAADVIERARAAPTARAAPSAADTAPRVRRRVGLRGTLPRRWIGLAAAASVAALMLWTQRTPQPNGTTWQPTAESQPLVEPPSDRNVAVFETRDPDITVIWFF